MTHLMFKKFVAIVVATAMVNYPIAVSAAGLFENLTNDLTKLGTTIIDGASNAVSQDEPSEEDAGNPEEPDSGGIPAWLSTAAGAVVGGWLGSKVGDGKGKTLATVLGIAGGAWLGSKMAESWTTADQTSVNQTSTSALENAADGETVAWTNPDTGATATVTPQATHSETRTVTFIRSKEIQSPPPFDVIGEVYVAKKSSNMRAGPSSDAPVIGGLGAGEAFMAMGKVTGQDWIIVGQGDRAIGYVFSSLVEKQMATTAEQSDNGNLRPSLEVKATQKGLSGDGAIDLDAEGIVVEEVTASASCRPTELTLSNSASGETEKSSFTACKSADGAWEIL